MRWCVCFRSFGMWADFDVGMVGNVDDRPWEFHSGQTRPGLRAHLSIEWTFTDRHHPPGGHEGGPHPYPNPNISRSLLLLLSDQALERGDRCPMSVGLFDGSDGS